jgi:3-deoxy-7-phosphoheptulonate synthase
MASGLSMPLGFKNTTSGAILPAINAIRAATQPQTFFGVTQDGVAAAITTKGNPNCHIILRGGDDRPNYDAYSVATTHKLLEKHGLPATIMIDAAHANSRKDHTQQPAVFREILHRVAADNSAVIGAMLESNLLAGSQPYPCPRGQLVHGQSITDPCVDWNTTQSLIRVAYQSLGDRGYRQA